ncbi:DUF2478 domain-containing protein [Consotaella aegiceratis]|uniref:DUF2478 domain-containing protein n=1 Tax=Consotaella aegiceratis TaxID=3097961 RepID=UPI002F42B8A0
MRETGSGESAATAPDVEIWLGAIVCDDRAAIDLILREVALDLKKRGIKVAGLVQAETCEASGSPKLALWDIASERTMPIGQNLGKGSHGCRLDTSRLSAASEELERQLDDSIELVIVNRFGKVEAEGRGLRSVICDAALRGIPVLLTVQTTHEDAWQEFEAGLAQPLAPAREAILAWCEAALATGRRRGHAPVQ